MKYIDTKTLRKILADEYCKGCVMHCESCSVAELIDWIEDQPNYDGMIECVFKIFARIKTLIESMDLVELDDKAKIAMLNQIAAYIRDYKDKWEKNE